MEYHQKETFTLRISRQRKGVREQEITVIGHGDVKTSFTAKLSQAVTAYLAGGDDFDVKPLGNPDAKKIIPPSDYREWQWDIIPQHGGTGRLILTIYALAPDGNSPDETIAKIEIPVHISNAEVFWHWLLDHPEIAWLFGAAVVGYVWTASRRRNKDSEKGEVADGERARTSGQRVRPPKRKR